MPTTVGVVGAGVTGLYVGRELARRGHRVLLYERTGRVGGRWKTTGGAEAPVEAGAWRVSLERHPLSLALLREYSPVDPIRYAAEAYVPLHGKTGAGDPAAIGPCPAGAGLSVRDWRVAQAGPRAAEHLNARSGYDGQDGGSCRVAEVYGARAVVGKKKERETGRYGAVRAGFGAVAGRLRADAEAAGVVFRPWHLVEGASPERCLRGVRRDARGRLEPFHTPPHDWLVWCVSPHELPEGDPDSNFALLRAAAVPAPLVHVYAPLPPGGGGPPFKYTTDAPCSQLIHHRPGSGHWQPCYASGGSARFWMRLHQYGDRRRFRRELERQCGAVLEAAGVPPARRRALLGTLRGPLRVHYWGEAVHMWAPVWGGGGPADRMRLACRPNPVRRPRVCVAGEAISTHQGWAEGCLQTANRVLALVGEGGPPRAPPRPPPGGFVYRGMALALEAGWLDRHPGGRGALEGHAGEDITALWDAQHHKSARALRLLFGFLAAKKSRAPGGGPP